MNFKQKLELTKIANILIYLADNTDNFGVTKANKLLYYLDCYHLRKYGRSVTKDIYKKLPQGPVPSDTYDRLKSIMELRDITEEFYSSIDSDFKEFFLEFIDIQIEQLSDSHRRFRIIAKKKFDNKYLSKSEMQSLEEIAIQFKTATAVELSNKTHKELPYINAEENSVVDLKLFVKDKVSAAEYSEIEYIEKVTNAMTINYG